MNRQYEKKTYKALLYIFLIWTLALIIFVIGIGNLINENVVTKVVYLSCLFMIYAIAHYVYKYDRIYWVSSFTYKETATMNTELRHNLASTFYFICLKFCVVLGFYFVLSMPLNTSILLDIAVFLIGLTWMAFSTHSSMLKEKKDFENRS